MYILQNPDDNKNGSLHFIMLHDNENRLFRQLSYGHLTYDINELNNLRQSIHTNQVLKHTLKINNIMNQERLRVNSGHNTPPPPTVTIPRYNYLHSMRNSNLLSANRYDYGDGDDADAGMPQYITKYELVDCTVIKNDLLPITRTAMTKRGRLKMFFKNVELRFPKKSDCFATSIPEFSEASLFKKHLKQYLSYELKRFQSLAS
ncbi:hypothetical protein G210_5947 [Candida maltosa Xu316]|uniref:Uncharacterized protein n=1 Tax=Candida maltosa (strain Xu316) TaxID=1245528 RepID=M3K1Z5_CANMX|nr:hypothetical protein G210_5947 [Candida maltosa Xu316]